MWVEKAIIALGVLGVVVLLLVVACIRLEGINKTPEEQKREDEEQMEWCKKHMK